MKKLFLTFFLSLFFISMVGAVSVEPYETVTLPQLTSNITPDMEGLVRTYLYCSWWIDDIGEEAILMGGTICPNQKKYFKFYDDETYYIRIDSALISYNEVNKNWTLIRTDTVDNLTIEYEIDVTEPPESLLNLMYNTILNKVKYWLCEIFGFCNL